MVTLIIDSCCDFVKTSERTPVVALNGQFILCILISLLGQNLLPKNSSHSSECNLVMGFDLCSSISLENTAEYFWQSDIPTWFICLLSWAVLHNAAFLLWRQFQRNYKQTWWLWLSLKASEEYPGWWSREWKGAMHSPDRLTDSIWNSKLSLLPWLSKVSQLESSWINFNLSIAVRAYIYSDDTLTSMRIHRCPDCIDSTWFKLTCLGTPRQQT